MTRASESGAGREGRERQTKNSTLHDTHRYAPSFGCVAERLGPRFGAVKRLCATLTDA